MAKPTKAQKKIRTVMHEFKAGSLHSGKKGPVVKSRKQAIAIALSEAGQPRRYAEGGAVDVAAPPVGITNLSSNPSMGPGQGQGQGQMIAQDQPNSPYYTPDSYGSNTGTGQGFGVSAAQSAPGMQVRNRTNGAAGVVGGPAAGFAKGGLVERPRGYGKAMKGIKKARVY